MRRSMNPARRQAEPAAGDPPASAGSSPSPRESGSRRSERSIRSNDLTGVREVAAVFVRCASPRVLAGALATLVVARTQLGSLGRGDVIVAAVTLAIAGPMEWAIHRGLLHAPDDAWATRRLGAGLGHRAHHLDPPAIEWLMLRGVDAAVIVVAFGAVTAAWSLPLLAIAGDSLAGSALAGPFVTAWALAVCGLLHYEWVHLLVHSRHRCRTRYYARLARNHRRHHYRNEHYWLGVTTNSGDRVFGTSPRRSEAVPLSQTARTLQR